MKNKIIILVLSLFTSQTFAGSIRVVTTTQDLRSIAELIGRRFGLTVLVIPIDKIGDEQSHQDCQTF